MYSSKRSGYTPIANIDEDREQGVQIVNLNHNGFQQLPNAWKAESKQKPKFVYVFSGVFLFLLATSYLMLRTYELSASQIYGTANVDNTMFDERGRYVMNNFDKKKPMSNFLSGLSGFWGEPMWTFYVNRGQAITSFGVQNKDGMIEKFQSADKAYQLTPFAGFRTFIKGRKSNGENFSRMPFFPLSSESQQCSANHPTESNTERKMMIGMNELEIEEIDESASLKTNILYFTMPEEDFPALIRRTTITNIDDKNSVFLDILDGLDKLIPSGLSNNYMDSMGRLAEAYMNVYNVGDRNDIHEPFYHISQSTADTAEVQTIKDGHFVVAFIEDNEKLSDDEYTTIPFIVDPEVVFGLDTSLINPTGFFTPGSPGALDLAKSSQVTTSRTPCSFAATSVKLPPGKSVVVTSVYGHAESLETFVNQISPMVRQPGFIEEKRARCTSIAEEITHRVKANTSSELFNKYVAQDFLDNTLRGGLPIVFGDSSNPKIYHTFNRVHGDIERDYNWFELDPTYFSQGQGNFRDVNQNRRNDIYFTPAIGDFNIRMFLSFVQADGYNPLLVTTTYFRVPVTAVDKLIDSIGVIMKESDSQTTSKKDQLKALLTAPFRIGQLFRDMHSKGITVTVTRENLLNQVLMAAEQSFAANFMQNGYWSDHWTYTLDLIESFVSVFPDKEKEMLWDSSPIPFYYSPAVVKTRAERYKVIDDATAPGGKKIRVYSAVSIWGDDSFPDAKKNEMIAIKASSSYIGSSSGDGGLWQRDLRSGDTFKVSVVAKLAMLGILKFSTMDPFGMGIEMEGGKPGWNDAMNGLPGLLGSGMPETYEMLRILKYLRSVIAKYSVEVMLPSEFQFFVHQVKQYLVDFFSSSQDNNAEFEYWDNINFAREAYRESTKIQFVGDTVSMSSQDFVDILDKMIDKVNHGIAKALATNHDLSPTYFYYECTNIVAISGTDKVQCKSFGLKTLPLFLEGPVRHLKVIDQISDREKVYEATKASNLFDRKLAMYTLSESLQAMGAEIGRMKAFSPGWLENQSVFLHMSYKYYLELLRGGLYDQFFAEIKTGLVPFMNNEVYGRSPLEASSFLVSSAFPDPKMHGASFMPRLSGSTAEFLSMWLIMTAGKTPFQIDPHTNKLILVFEPKLPGWMFHEDGTLTFNFLGSVPVTYHNDKRIDTWKLFVSKVTVELKDGQEIEFCDGIVKDGFPEDIRNLLAEQIHVYF